MVYKVATFRLKDKLIRYFNYIAANNPLKLMRKEVTNRERYSSVNSRL